MSSDPVSDPAPVAPSPGDIGTKPRLGILQLMIWTAGIAIAFAITRSLGVWQELEEQWRGSEGHEALQHVWAAAFVGAHCVFFATALGGVLLFLVRRRRRVNFPRHPGEWLLVTFSVSLLLMQLMWVAVLMFQPGAVGSTSQSRQLMEFILVVGFGLLQVAGSVGLFAFAAFRAELGRWRLFFIIAAVVQLSQLLSCVYFFALLIPDVALAIVLVKDQKQALRYPWPHWLGVVSYMSYGLFHIVAIVVSGLLFWLT